MDVSYTYVQCMCTGSRVVRALRPAVFSNIFICLTVA